jgi:hypothetical protein
VNRMICIFRILCYKNRSSFAFGRVHIIDKEIGFNE